MIDLLAIGNVLIWFVCLNMITAGLMFASYFVSYYRKGGAKLEKYDDKKFSLKTEIRDFLFVGLFGYFLAYPLAVIELGGDMADLRIKKLKRKARKKKAVF